MALTSEELKAIRERCEEVSPAPWHAGEGILKWYVESEDGDLRFSLQELHQMDGHEWPAGECAQFIAAARQDVPRLLDTVEELRGLLDRVQTYYGWGDDLALRAEIEEALHGPRV